MRQRESALWNWLKKGAMQLGPELHWHRVENVCDRGTPDIEGVLGGYGFVTELKSVKVKKNMMVDCELSSDQAMFLMARSKADGTAWVLVRAVFSDGVMKHYLIKGSQAQELLKPVSTSWLWANSHCDRYGSAASIIETMAQ